MRRCVALFMVLAFAVVCSAQEKPKAQVMIVGVYHFDNPTLWIAAICNCSNSTY